MDGGAFSVSGGRAVSGTPLAEAVVAGDALLIMTGGGGASKVVSLAVVVLSTLASIAWCDEETDGRWCGTRSDVTSAVADVACGASGKMKSGVGDVAATPAAATDGPGLGSRDFGGSPKKLRILFPAPYLERIVQNFEDVQPRCKRRSPFKSRRSISAGLEQADPMLSFSGRTK